MDTPHRKASALHRSDAIRRSPPMPPEPFDYGLNVSTEVVGMLPAPAGLKALRLEKDGTPLGPPVNVVGYLVLRHFGYPDDVKLTVKAVSDLGVLKRPYALLPNRESRNPLTHVEWKEAIADGVAAGFYNLVTSGTSMPTNDFFDSVHDAVEAAMEKLLRKPKKN
jgi:hypothetical protein